MKRFTCYATIGGDLKHVIVNQSDLAKAFRDAKKHSVRFGESWLYDAQTDKMIAHFVHGVSSLSTVQSETARSVQYVPQGPKINPSLPRPQDIGAVSIGSHKDRKAMGIPSLSIAQFATQAKALRGMEILRNQFNLQAGMPFKSPTTKYWVLNFWIGGSNVETYSINPKFRLGQRRVYPVKGKVSPRYKGSLPSRQTTFTSHRKAVAASNPRGGVKIYGKLLRIEAQKTQKHICDAECKRVNHCYYHDFKAGASIYGMPDGSLVIR